MNNSKSIHWQNSWVAKGKKSVVDDYESDILDDEVLKEDKALM